ncbi:hypothetical protein CTEN210_07568 [Chaetoceros tenuissimus]|uniref:Uncharacterized protein n=1 Tax=Chaetoceros tenuissimus TaxID=426638 RepID=A0AAD3H587_9STRA|nr:hypothetical protein CTEN210_07568 [Chaetoceros tenuissimus]
MKSISSISSIRSLQSSSMVMEKVLGGNASSSDLSRVQSNGIFATNMRRNKSGFSSISMPNMYSHDATCRVTSLDLDSSENSSKNFQFTDCSYDNSMEDNRISIGSLFFAVRDQVPKQPSFTEGMEFFSCPLFSNGTGPLGISKIHAESITCFNRGIKKVQEGDDRRGIVYFKQSCQTLEDSPCNLMTDILQAIYKLNIGHSHWRLKEIDLSISAYKGCATIFSKSYKEASSPREELRHLCLLSKWIGAAAINCIAVANLQTLPVDETLFSDKIRECEILLSSSVKTLKISSSHFSPLFGDDRFFELLATFSNNLGRVHYCADRLEAAYELYQESLELRSQMVRVYKPDVAVLFYNMGQVCNANQNYEKAFSFYNKFLSSINAEWGFGNETAVRGVLDLADVCLRMESGYDKAEEALSCCLVDRLSDSLKVQVLDKLGHILVLQSNLEKALEVFHESILVERQFRGEGSNINVVTKCYSIAMILTENGFLCEAHCIFEKTLKFLEDMKQVPSLEDFVKRTSIEIRNAMASIWKELDDFSKAEKELLIALELKREHYGPDHYELSSTLNSLGLVQYALGNFHSALNSFIQCRTIRTQSPESSTQSLLSITYNIAGIYKSIGEYELALSSFQEVLSAERSGPISDPQDIVNNFFQMFSVYKSMNREEEGIPHLREATRFCATYKAEISNELGITVYCALGNVLLMNDNKKEALELYTTSMKLFDWQEENFYLFSDKMNSMMLSKVTQNQPLVDSAPAA